MGLDFYPHTDHVILPMYNPQVGVIY